MRFGGVGARGLAAIAAFGLICALGAGAAAAGVDAGAAGGTYPAPCGYGFPKPPPKRYHFRVEGTTGYHYYGTETFLYRGVMKRLHCRGTAVEYWQTKGKGTLSFNNIDTGEVDDCNYTGPPYESVGNAPAHTFPL